jgi:AcrR family transcriptional regulator
MRPPSIRPFVAFQESNQYSISGMAKSTRVPGAATVQPPQQERSRASFERVVKAATALLEDGGYDGFTLAEVSKRANVSIGSIYARVKSKDDLFYVIQDRYMTLTEDRPRLRDPADWERLEPQDVVVGVVNELGDSFQVNQQLLRVFMHRGIVDPVVAARSSASVSRVHDEVEAILMTQREAIAHDEPALAIDVAFRMAWGTLARQIMYGATFESKRVIAWDTLVAELGRACAAYLLAAGDVSAGGSSAGTRRSPRRARA